MHPVARTLIALGALLVVVGLLWQFGGRYLRLGQMPGDFTFRRGNMQIYFPLVSSLLVSATLTLLFWIWRRLGG
jgi:hypothetical protein